MIQTTLEQGYVSVVVTRGCVDNTAMYGSIPSVAAKLSVSGNSRLTVTCVLRFDLVPDGDVVCIAPGSTIIVRLCGMRRFLEDNVDTQKRKSPKDIKGVACSTLKNTIFQ